MGVKRESDRERGLASKSRKQNPLPIREEEVKKCVLGETEKKKERKLSHAGRGDYYGWFKKGKKF